MSTNINGILVMLTLGMVFFIRGFLAHKRKRIIEDTPTSKVRSLAMGMVEIYGNPEIYNKEILKSPFSNKDCVYLKYSIEEYRRLGKNSRWVTLKFADNRINFYLRDETGKVLIDPKDAVIDITYDNQYTSSVGKEPPVNVIKFLKENGLAYENFIGINKTMRYTEYFIEPADKIYILGTAGVNPFLKEGSAQTNDEGIMISRNKSVYYISDKPEKEILSKFKWKIIGGLFGGSTLIIVSLIILFIQLKIL